MRRALWVLLVLVLLAAFLGLCVRPASAYERAIPAPTRAFGMLDAFNHERQMAGVHQLILDDELTNMAQPISLDMVERNYFAHVSPEGKSWWDYLAEYKRAWWSAGQVLGRAPGTDAESERLVVEAFMHSATHKALILNPNLNYVGVGAAIDPAGVTVFTMLLTN